MLSVSEFLNSFSKNQLVIRISVQIDNFTELDYPSGSHIHFDDDNVQLTNFKVSPQNYPFIIEGITKTEQEIKLFWGEKHFDLLKNTAPCTETITEFEVLKQQINTRECVNLNELHTVFLVVLKKEAINLIDDRTKKVTTVMIPLIVIVIYHVSLKLSQNLIMRHR